MAHNYHHGCGCLACCNAEEAEERRIAAFGTASTRGRRNPFGALPYHPEHDILHTVRRYRTTRRESAGCAAYLDARRRSCVRTLRTLATAETGIKQRNALVPTNLHPVFETLFAPFRRAA